MHTSYCSSDTWHFLIFRQASRPASGTSLRPKSSLSLKPSRPASSLSLRPRSSRPASSFSLRPATSSNRFLAYTVNSTVCTVCTVMISLSRTMLHSGQVCTPHTPQYPMHIVYACMPLCICICAQYLTCLCSSVHLPLLTRKCNVAGSPERLHEMVRDTARKLEKHELICVVSRTISCSILKSPLHFICFLAVYCTIHLVYVVHSVHDACISILKIFFFFEITWYIVYWNTVGTKSSIVCF